MTYEDFKETQYQQQMQDDEAKFEELKDEYAQKLWDEPVLSLENALGELTVNRSEELEKQILMCEPLTGKGMEQLGRMIYDIIEWYIDRTATDKANDEYSS